MKVIKVTIKDYTYTVSENGVEYKEMVFPIEIPYSEEDMKWAEENCYDGKPEVFDREEPKAPETTDDSAVWDELDAAYQEGVDSV